MKITKPVIIAVSMIAVMGAAGAVSYAVAQKHDGSYKVAHRGDSGKEFRGHRGHWRGKHRGRGHRRMLERFDTNGDEKLTQEELNQARSDLLKRHDANSDGNIDLKELKTCGSKSGSKELYAASSVWIRMVTPKSLARNF